MRAFCGVTDRDAGQAMSNQNDLFRLASSQPGDEASGHFQSDVLGRDAVRAHARQIRCKGPVTRFGGSILHAIPAPSPMQAAVYWNEGAMS
jgi:hypothetical protein